MQRRRTSLSTSNSAANKHSLGLSNKHKPLDSCASTYNKNNITKNINEHLSKAVPKLQNKLQQEKQSTQFVGDYPELDNSIISSCTSDITNSFLDISTTPERARFSSNDSKRAISPISTLNDSGFIDNNKMSSSSSNNSPAVKLGMPTSFSSQKLETDTLSIEQWAAEQFKKSLIPMKEDLAEWITSIFHKYKIEHYALSPDTLISQLANGQVLCRLAQTFSSAHKNTPKSPVFSLRKNPGIYLCRDNCANFLSWASQLGVRQVCMFESNNLVDHKNATIRDVRQVLICLLDVAKILFKSHGESTIPELIKLENDIEEDRRKNIQNMVNPVKRLSIQPSRVCSLTNAPQEADLTWKPEIRSKSHCSVQNFERRTPNFAKPITRKIKSSPPPKEMLDAEVQKVMLSQPFGGRLKLERVAEGKYKIDEKLVFIRVSKIKF